MSKYKKIPQEDIKIQYGLNKLVHNGNVYVRNDKVWYGLKKVGKLANADMVALLETHGYI